MITVSHFLEKKKFTFHFWLLSPDQGYPHKLYCVFHELRHIKETLMTSNTCKMQFSCQVLRHQRSQQPFYYPIYRRCSLFVPCCCHCSPCCSRCCHLCCCCPSCCC